jgi:cobalt-precorrin-5B (C1)-methyltransferase
MEIIATIKLTDDGKITIKSGEGIGKVTNPVCKCLSAKAQSTLYKEHDYRSCQKSLPAGRGVEVTISAPEGANIAKKTMNAKLGVLGGVSILGTIGVVKPLSLEACRRSLVPQLDVAMARGYKRILFVPGNIGERIAKQQFGVPEDAIVQTGDFVGYMLDKAVEKGGKSFYSTLWKTGKVLLTSLIHIIKSGMLETKSSLHTQAPQS